MFIKILIGTLTIVLLSMISCKNTESTDPNVNPPQQIDTSDINISFSKITIAPLQNGSAFGDISFSTNGYGVVSSADDNRLFVTKNNGQTWQQLNWTPAFGFPIYCIAIKNDGSEIFVGSTSGGDSYPGRYVILSTEGDSIIYSGNVNLYNAGNPNFNFIQAYYNYEDALWVAMGNNSKDDGNVLVKHSNTYSLWDDIDPLIGRKNYVSSIVRNKKGENIIGMFDYNGFQKGIFIKRFHSSEYEKLTIYTSTPYQVELPMSLSLSTSELLLAAYSGGPNDSRLYLSTSTLALWRKVVYSGIVGNFKSVKFDNQNYIWVCTNSGLYKSVQQVN
ncbi:MAG: hypothetical protein IT276_12425 [Ignavibacteriaceae bacterium]|nr:hypothetical protein [Ignavibacterium sp.]MCC6255713.1 hypothetical protein [Ignavibacteriaceae bacterium]HMN25681.1 hypothetical protein [Ignavibacteriaceae bacterium]HRN26067.1 hypothetical protein [Ignavibacteriaceae bacterium]HRQ53670.1 hypothetical protein [Ignavibacteriaceae bacterium]